LGFFIQTVGKKESKAKQSVFIMPGSKRYSVPKQEEIREKRQMKLCNTKTRKERSTTTCTQTLFIGLPLVDVFVSVTTLLTCYLLTERAGGQVRMLFPNEISVGDTQRSIFSIGISISSFISLLITTLKYKQTGSIFDGFANQSAFVCGSLSAFSQFVIGNFPMKSELSVVNLIAVVGFLVFSVLNCCFQTYLTRNTPVISSKRMYISRILLLEFALLSGAVLSAFLVPVLSQWNRAPSNVAQIASWCCLSFLLLYKLTFVNDLKQMYFHLDILISPSQAEAIYQQSEPNRRLLIDDDSASTRISTRSKMSQQSSAVRSTGTMSEVNTIFNYPDERKSSV
jgi:Frag1/DRAM/Sfk1 family.